MANRSRQPLLSRRDVLKLLGIGGVSAVAAKFILDSPLFPFHLVEASEPEKTGPGWGMVIDLENCTGCGYCTNACNATNNLPEDILWNVITTEQTSYGREYFLPRPCLHCDNAPCIDVCPVEATYKRNDGLVIMDYGKCIGCRYCQVACPYGARMFNWKPPEEVEDRDPQWGDPEIEQRPRGVIEKCTFCIHRIDEGLARGLTPGEDPDATPACCTVCPASARFFGDLNDPHSRVSLLLQDRPWLRLREELGTEARVYYLLPEGGI